MTCNHTTYLFDLPCGCVDVVFSYGFIDLEHDHVECDGAPVASPIRPNPDWDPDWTPPGYS